MNQPSSRPWWLRKRMIFPLALLVGVAGASLIAFEDSNATIIMIYNQTGNPLPPLLVRACDQTRTFAGLADQESLRMVLAPRGAESAVHLELGIEPPWRWDGPLVKSHGGGRVTIRLLPGGQAEAFEDISWWQRILE